MSVERETSVERRARLARLERSAGARSQSQAADRAATERLVEAMAETSLTHTLLALSRSFGCTCGWTGDTYAEHATRVAAMLLAGPVGEALAAAKREALEDAARCADVAFDYDDALSPQACEQVRRWLRDCAAEAQP